MGDLRLDLSMAGTLSDLQMQASMQADAIRIDYEWSPGRRIPEIRDLDLQITADQQTLRLSPLQLTLNRDSHIRLNGEVALDALSKALETRDQDANWPLLLVQQFNGRLQLDQWRGEEWAAVLPGMLRPAGVLSADVSIKPGIQLNGAVAFGGFSLRPTASLPSINDINGTVQLNGRSLQLTEAGARIGEQNLTANGWLDWTQLNDLTWQLGIQGERILLVRSSTMMLRTDVDLAFSRESSVAKPRVHGSLNLRNSTLLHDLDLLSGSTRGGPPRRPPYFAVDAALMRDWELDVELNGDAFMRVRSNYFSALLSADFHLSGTMGSPLLIGSATADSAELRFPGARMRLTHAEVFIDRDRPTVEQLLISGISERASYIVTMEVSNTLSDPRVRFQSTPSLPNASILRLLTTGSLSGSNFSGIGLYLGQGLLGPGSADSPLNRLTVDIGRDISRSGRNTVDVEFDINDRWAIEGEYDRFDAYNLDLIWKVFER
jgi:translocation and assembly module TamB